MSVIISKEVAHAKDTLRDRLVDAFLSTSIFGASREMIRQAVGNALDDFVQAILKQARAKKDKDESKSTTTEN